MNMSDENELVLLDGGSLDLIGGGAIYRPIPVTRWWLGLYRRYF